MPGNLFGTQFRIQTFGESHGPGIGAIVDGIPPGIALSDADIQPFLERRKPGQSKYTTQRREQDEVRILSGVFEGLTTGTPVHLWIENTDQRSKDYNEIKERYRPGHADITYDMKYGIRDYRGGGRSSARETAARVAAGALAIKTLDHLLDQPVQILGYLTQIGHDRIEREKFDKSLIDQNPFWCPDPDALIRWQELLATIRKKGSSVGAVVEVVATGVPAGLGEPVFDKLDSDLAKAIMSINAVKGVEIGAGMRAATLTGEENADEIRKGPDFLSNNAGGILGGISSGQPVIVRFALKPTSSILTPMRSIDRSGNEIEVATKGRHDPCVGIRAVPVGEAMMAIVLCDHLLRYLSIRPDAPFLNKK